MPHQENANWKPEVDNSVGAPDILVLDDAGFIFRNAPYERSWRLQTTTTGSWILIKLSAPIAQGALWRRLVPLDDASRGHADRLICLVSAQDLRREAALIGHGASWERTLEDLGNALETHALAPLSRCRHLVITFGGDAALWIQPKWTNEPARFCFVAADAEGDYSDRIDGEAIGYLTSMAASLAYGISQSPAEALDLSPWMEAGLHAMRDLLYQGHGEVQDANSKQPTGFPHERLAEIILTPRKGLSRLEIAWPPNRRSPQARTAIWTMVEASQRPLDGNGPRSLIGLASEVLRRGANAYGGLPHAEFGKFVTAERSEIEMLRTIRRQMLTYKRVSKTGEKPLCLGVFGPPGAGKSFAVREISEQLFGQNSWLEFNLSQFNGTTDLNGALHQVRDKVLDGQTPVVFWDEFDSQRLKWLQYLLAPMQDGRFQDGQVTHAVGRSVFIFAGGTAWVWSDFGEGRDGEDVKELKLLKAPDFKSRLDAYYNVSGPNPRPITRDGTSANLSRFAEANDIGYTLRRAMLIRGQLRLDDHTRLEVDTDLMRALLMGPDYRHGARSLEKLVKALYPRPGAALRRSDLPPPAQLDLYVDAKRFLAILGEGRAFMERGAPEKIAPHIHAAYLKRERAADRKIASRYDKEYIELDDAGKHDNLEAAQRIPAILALAGLGVASNPNGKSWRDPDRSTVDAHLRCNLERLAEAEHDGWWDVRRRDGWTQGEPRDDDALIHPLMKQYSELPDIAQDRDRASVQAYPDRLSEAGYRIVWLAPAKAKLDSRSEKI